jgi:hypothetical protein
MYPLFVTKNLLSWNGRSLFFRWSSWESLASSIIPMLDGLLTECEESQERYLELDPSDERKAAPHHQAGQQTCLLDQ